MSTGYNVSDTLVHRTQRMAQNSGVSWSIQGHIAYALEEGQSDHFSESEGNLRISYLECIDGKHWQLAPPTSFNVASLVAETNVNLAHKPFAATHTVLFSNTGWDLFTCDIDGNVTILVTGIKKVSGENANRNFVNPNEQLNDTIVQVQYSRTSFNSCEVFYTDHNNPKFLKEKDNEIVAAKWLNLDKSVISNIPAIRIEQNNDNKVLNGCASKMGAAADDASGYYYRYNAHQHKAYGAKHPLSTKQACVALRKNGQLCLFHQQDHGIDYSSVVADLESDVSKSGGISKASIGFLKNGKIVVSAYYEKSKMLAFYEVEINWNYLNKAAEMLVDNPNFKISNEDRILPTLKVKNIYKQNINNTLENSTFVDVKLVSPNFEQDSNLDVLLIFEKKNLLLEESVQSSILRYKLESVSFKNHIHQSFKDIGSKNGNDVLSVTGDLYKLKYLQSIAFNDYILDIDMLHLDMFIAVILSSGYIKLFARKTFAEIENKFGTKFTEENFKDKQFHLPETISTLLDAGFDFPRFEKQPIYCKISPNLCSYVILPHYSSSLEISCMNSLNVDKSYYDGKRKGLLLTKAAALALRHTTACYFGCFTDDLVATIRSELMVLAKLVSENYSYRLMISVVQEGHRAINLNIDIPPEQSDKMTQNQPLQRLLTLQLSLGTSENWKRTRSGKVAFALVNLRYVASSVMYTIHTIYSNMQRFARKGFPATDTLSNAKLREECILSILGIIRWCLDYVVLLSQELLELDGAFKTQNNQKIDKLIKESLVIPLILGKIPRSFLVFSIANIRRLFSFVQKFVEKSDPNLTAKITPDNPLGAFDVVEEIFSSNDSSAIQKKFNGNGKAGSGANSKNGKAIVTAPTLEAYYRLGLMIKRLPVSLVAFEKFLSEADGPLRNMKLDAPMSLAVEQQIVCQGYVSKNFTSAMKKLSEVFYKSVLGVSGTKLSDLYFYDVTWLGLDTVDEDFDDFESNFGSRDFDSNDQMDIDELPLKQENITSDFNDREATFGKGTVLLSSTDLRKTRNCYRKLIYKSIENGGLVDSLRKEWISPDDVMEFPKKSVRVKTVHSMTGGALGSLNTAISTTTSATIDGEKKPTLRRCIRCGSISRIQDEVMFIPNSMAFVSNPVFQHYQRICICGGSWANL